MEKLIPRLRFPGFDGTWNRLYIKNILSIGSGRDYKHLKGGNIPVFGSGGQMTTVDKFLYDGETVCIGRKGTIDKPMYYNGKLWTVDTLFYTYNFNQVLPKFVYLLFQQISWKEHNEASGVPSLSKNIIEKIAVVVPAMDEQQSISLLFDSIDSKLNHLRKKKSLLEKYKKGMMQKIFNQEVRFKDEVGGDFSSAPFGHAPSGGEWEENTLGSLGKFLGGGTPSKIDESNYSGSIPWISSSDLFDNDIRKISISRYITSDAVSKSATKLVPAESVLIVSRVGVGKVAVNKVDVCTSQDFTNFIPTSCNSYFIAYLLSYKTNELLSFMQGTSIKGFVKSDLEDMKVQFPTIKEQSKIANFLSVIDDKIELVAGKIEKMEIWKKGLLGEMFV